MTRFGFVVDLDKCTGCQTCEIACKYENGIALGERWTRVVPVGPSGTFPHIEQYFLPVMCQQCENAPCVRVCPTGASYRDADTNVVLVDKSKCIGCKYCMMACPYGVRSWNAKEACAEKCTMCQHLDEPPCSVNCPAACRMAGDLDDPESAPARALASADAASTHQLGDAGNHPTTYYILSDSCASWKSGD